MEVCLCSFECSFSVPFAESKHENTVRFVNDVRGWGGICRNLFIYNYTVNFRNYLFPFPNIYTMKPNYRMFLESGARWIYDQADSNGHHAEFAELKCYLQSKLMWNPDADADSLMHTFMKGYYGDAAPYLYQYQKIMQGALLASGQPLWIYDSPISHKKGMLNPHLMKVYDELFDQAEKAVASDKTLLDRVRLSRLSLQYSQLEIARTEADSDKEKSKELLALFEERTREYGVKSLNERNNPPAEYCVLYRKRFLPQNKNIL